VLVSEVMLQQTQVSRVLGPYRRFIERFSTPAACAAARVADVVVAWEGLGYNRRAVYLHRTAGVLVERHGGRVPVDLTALV
jgi:A/G-specific adenine glycosylase